MCIVCRYTKTSFSTGLARFTIDKTLECISYQQGSFVLLKKIGDLLVQVFVHLLFVLNEKQLQIAHLRDLMYFKVLLCFSPAAAVLLSYVL